MCRLLLCLTLKMPIWCDCTHGTGCCKRESHSSCSWGCLKAPGIFCIRLLEFIGLKGAAKKLTIILVFAGKRYTFLEHLAKRCVRFYFFSLYYFSSCLFSSALHFSSNYGLAVLFSFCSFFCDESMYVILIVLLLCFKWSFIIYNRELVMDTWRMNTMRCVLVTPR